MQEVDVVGTVTSTFDKNRSSLMSTYKDFSTFVVNDYVLKFQWAHSF